MDIKDELKNNSITLLIIPTETYNQTILDITKQISDENICYISLNKTYNALNDSFKKSSIPTKNMYFIDGITNKMLNGAQNTEKYIFLGAPNNLNEMNISISKILEKRKIKYIIFDSVSTLLIYEKPSTVIQFIHTLASKLRSQNLFTIFTILKKDLTPKMQMFADKVIDLGSEEK